MSSREDWYFRNVDGSVYGPTDLASLSVWAKEGRVTPAGYVSRDGRDWMPAPSLKDLEMWWLVETEPRKWFGPFHIDVVNGLRAKGSLPPGTRVYRLWDGEAAEPAPKVVEKVVEKDVVKVVEKRVEVPVEKTVLKEVRVEVPVEKVVVKEVRVEVPVERIVEKRVEVPVEKIVEKEVVKVVEKRVEVPVEKIVEKEVVKVVEKRVEVPVEKTVVKEVRVEVPVDRVVEKIVEVPVERVVEKIVEVPVDRVVEKIVEVPVEVKPSREVYGDAVPAARVEMAKPTDAFRGMFKGADRSSMAALEAAARREILAAKRSRSGIDLFRRKTK